MAFLKIGLSGNYTQILRGVYKINPDYYAEKKIQGKVHGIKVS